MHMHTHAHTCSYWNNIGHATHIHNVLLSYLGLYHAFAGLSMKWLGSGEEVGWPKSKSTSSSDSRHYDVEIYCILSLLIIENDCSCSKYLIIRIVVINQNSSLNHHITSISYEVWTCLHPDTSVHYQVPWSPLAILVCKRLIADHNATRSSTKDNWAAADVPRSRRWHHKRDSNRSSGHSESGPFFSSKPTH